MTFTTLSLVMTVVILNIHHLSTAKPVPKVIRVLFFTCLGRLLCMPAVYGYRHTDYAAPKIKPSENKKKHALYSTRNQINTESRGASTSSSVYSIRSSVGRNRPEVDDQDSQPITEHIALETKYCENADLMKELAESGLVLVSREELNNALIKHSDTDLQSTDSDSNLWQCEWPLLASVLDRLFLLIYLALVVFAFVYLVNAFLL